jgi:excisionase family DNA binding protein
VLTTEQAARLLGVSRPFVVRLIDSGSIALHQRVGNQRRVLGSAVLAWQSSERSRQAKALKQLAGDLDDEIFGAT